MKRAVLTCALIAAAGTGLWFGMEARREAPRLTAIAAVCRAVEEERYDDAIAGSESLVTPDAAGGAPVRTRIGTAPRRERL